MKKLISSLILSGVMALILIITAVPVLAETSVSSEIGGTSVTDTVAGTVYGTSGDTTTTGDTNTTGVTNTTVVDNNGQTVTAGTLPDSPLYWFTNLIEKLQLALTFDPAKKAKLLEHQALEKLAEASELLKKEKPLEAQKALENYTNKVSAAQDFLTQVKDPASPKAQILIDALNKTQAANISVLTGLLDKLPPQAAKKIALNIVRSMEKAVEKQIPGTVTDQVYNPLKIDQDKDEDQAKNKAKINNEIKIALKSLRHDLEQKGTKENMPKLQNVANSVYTIHKQFEQSSNEQQKEVNSPRDIGRKQKDEKQQGKGKEGNSPKGNHGRQD